MNADTAKGILGIVLVALFVLLLALSPTLFFAVRGDKAAAAASGTTTAALVLGFTHYLAYVMGRRHARQTMLDGADVALKAQAVNDAWDTRKAAVFGRVFQEGSRAARAIRPVQADPVAALMAPGDDLSWLPELDGAMIDNEIQ